VVWRVPDEDAIHGKRLEIESKYLEIGVPSRAPFIESAIKAELKIASSIQKLALQEQLPEFPTFQPCLPIFWNFGKNKR